MTTYAEAKAWCVKKLGGKCSDCGTESEYYEIYDFHHKNGRKGLKQSKTAHNCNYQYVLKWYRNKKIPSDIELLCSNCHRIRTKRKIISHLKPKLLGKVFSEEFKWKFGF